MSRAKLLPLASAAIGGLTVTLVILIGRPFGTTTTHTKVISSQSSGASHYAAQTSTALTASQVYARDAHGVVAIRSTSNAGGGGATESLFGGEQSATEVDTGTGIIFSSSGLIVTNYHVVKGASDITVSFDGEDGTTRKATVVATDPSSDLAVLKVSTSGLELHPLTFGNSSLAEIGDPVYAIGNPFGLNWTLTTGVVSALNRQIDAPDGATINGVIQTDAALNPGNSGGPLINSAGEVIGINSQIISGASTSTGQGSDSGVGFAIAGNTVKAVIQKLVGGV